MGMGWSGHNGFGVNGSGAGLSTNNATAANLTYGIGVGVATNGQTTLLAIGGAVAGTYVTTGAGHAVASGSGQSVGVAMAFESSLPKPAAGEVVRVSQFIGVVVNMGDSSPTHHANQSADGATHPAGVDGDQHDVKNHAPHQDHTTQQGETKVGSVNDQAAQPMPNANAPLTMVDRVSATTTATLASTTESNAVLSAVTLSGSKTIATSQTDINHAVAVVQSGGATAAFTVVATRPGSGTTPVDLVQTITITAEAEMGDPRRREHHHEHDQANKDQVPHDQLPHDQFNQDPHTTGVTVSTTPVEAGTPASTAPSPTAASASAGGQGTAQARAPQQSQSTALGEGVSLAKTNVPLGVTSTPTQPAEDNASKKQESKPQESKPQESKPQESKPQESKPSGSKSVPDNQSIDTTHEGDKHTQDHKKSEQPSAPSDQGSQPKAISTPAATGSQPSNTGPSTAAATADAAGGAHTANATLAADAGAKATSASQAATSPGGSTAASTGAGVAGAGAGASLGQSGGTAGASGVSAADTGAATKTKP